jgi:hypothetical protein
MQEHDDGSFGAALHHLVMMASMPADVVAKAIATVNERFHAHLVHHVLLATAPTPAHTGPAEPAPEVPPSA